MPKRAAARAFVAAILCAAPGAAFAQPDARPSPATPAAEQEAEARFRKGIDFYKRGDHRLALTEFERAYSVAPNYRVLFNIGQVNIQLGSYAAAYRALERYLSEGGDQIPADRRAQVDKDLEFLRDRTANVTFETNVPAEIFIDDVSCGTTPLDEDTLVDAGRSVVVRAVADGYEPATKLVTFAGAERARVRLELKPKKPLVVVQAEAPKRSDAPIAVALTATTAFTAAAVVTGILSLNAQSTLKDLREGAFVVGDDELESAARKARTYALVADVSAGAAIVSAAVSIYLLARPSPKATKPPSVGLFVGPSGGALRGSF